MLGQLIRGHRQRSHKLKHKFTILNPLPNEMEPYPNMLRPLVEDGVLSYLHARLIITQYQQSLPLMINSHLYLKLLQIQALLHRMCYETHLY
jgi:hypothetical protein